VQELEALRSAYQRAQLVDEVEPGDLTRPTPCSDWDVRGLVAHSVAGADGLAVQLRGVTPDWQKDTLGDDPAAELRQSLQNALTEWRRPGAVETASPMVPGMRIIDFAPADAVHVGPGYSAWPGRPAERGSCRPSSMASGHRGPPRRDAASERSVLVSTWPTTPPCLIGSSGCLAALPPEVARSAWSFTAGRWTKGSRDSARRR